MRVLQLDLVDHVDAEVQVHGLIAQDVLELLRYPGHLVAPAHGQDLGEPAVEEDALRDRVEADQVAQQVWSVSSVPVLKVGSHSSWVWLMLQAAFLATEGTSRYMLKTSPSSMPRDSMQYW